MLSVKEINLLQAQNEGLKKQNAELQKENAILKEGNYDKLIAWEEMQAENERLKKENEILLGQLVINDGEDITVQISKSQFDEYNKYRQTLQEIKAIAEELLEKGLEPQSVEHQLRLRGKRELASIIIDLITKAESEDNQ